VAHAAPRLPQETLKRLGSQLEVYEAQLEAQRLETRAAQELLAQAEAEMESVHFEKKKLVARWKSSLNAVARCAQAAALQSWPAGWLALPRLCAPAAGLLAFPRYMHGLLGGWWATRGRPG
jgi:hypothetical protein